MNYVNYKWYDRSAIYGGVFMGAFNETESYFSNPIPSISKPGFEIGINVLQRSERFYQYKVGASFQRLYMMELLDINGRSIDSELRLNIINAHITPLVLSYRHKLFRGGIGVGGYGAYIFPPTHLLGKEETPIYNDTNTLDYDYGFHINLNLQYHYFFVEFKWLNGLANFYESDDLRKRFGMLGINIQILLP